MSTAVAGVLILLTALTLGLPAPLAAVHILWINLVTDGAVALPLSTGAVEADVMQRRPVPAREPLLTPPLLRRAAVMVPAMLLSALGWFAWRLHAGAPLAVASTEAFTVLAAAQWFNALNCRSEHASVLRLGIVRDRWLLFGIGAGMLLHAIALYTSIGNRLLHTTPLSLLTLAETVLVASLVLWVEEIHKLVIRYTRRGGGGRVVSKRLALAAAHGSE